ncbi:fibulin-1 [Oryzias melastigma]|uniref:Fibulin-1 n=1 Tax=Oryzias melastigma TaxID=30732 RepID=A0A3B3C715_ORYME|nr:fibulin-1 [Oryzias melastigma]
MALRIILLLSVGGVLGWEENKLLSVEECCNLGRATAIREHDCAAQKVLTSAMCSIIQEQCCRASAGEMACKGGIKMARGQGACERAFFTGFDWQTLISQICCDCCTLGLMVAKNGWSCDFRGLQLEKQCSDAAKSCCDQPKEIRPTIKVPEEPKKFTTPPPQMTRSCRDANCSQLCLENGMCACREGFQMRIDGVTCQDIDECQTGRHNCSPGQVCLNTDGSFHCKPRCGTGYVLAAENHCEDIDECAFGTHDCEANFVCLNTPGSFHCEPKSVCKDGFVQDSTGSCVDINECLTRTDACQPDQFCINSEGSYTCRSSTDDCKHGYQLTPDGSRCEDVNECLTSSHNCAPGEICLNTEGSFHCQSNCAPGFHFTPENKCKDIDECALWTHNCEANFVCINTVGSYRCQPKQGCEDGYIQDSAGNCIDVDECLTGNLCGSRACVNTEGSYHCECQNGFMYSRVSKKCEDIDECALWTSTCGPNFLCVNTDGSFLCHPNKACGDGYILDSAGKCIDVNECVTHTHPCRPGQACINTVGSFYCRSVVTSCARGYHLNFDGTHCEDVDECVLLNVCGGHGTCVNTEGSYRCECQNGFTFNSISKLCEDINECRHYTGRLCAHKCENTEGSYHCSCIKGFKLAENGKNCEDVDECEANPCSQECANVYGSYQCYCRRGYELNDIDGTTCEDIDECTIPNVCSYRCINTVGGFNCTCPSSGYTLGPDGRSCQDVDECATGTHTCSASESCFNIQGGFRCLYFDCPPNFRRATSGSESETSIFVRCIKSCKRHDTDCANDPVLVITSTVLSLPTLRKLEEPEDIAVLRTAAAAKPDPLPDEPQVYFDIQATDEQYSFDVVKRSQHGMILGVIRQVKPILGPRELVLEVTVNYVQSGVISQQNIVIIHVYISEL